MAGHEARRRDEDLRRLARGADRIARMILGPGYAAVDIDIAIERLRDEAERLFPGTTDLFERLYAARFRRLREQFRSRAARPE